MSTEAAETPGPRIARPMTCALCGASFTCGPGTGANPGQCWCQNLPLLATIDPAADCLCPACLTTSLAAETTR